MGASKRAVLVGGTGRVGGAIAAALSAHDPGIEIVIAGRRRQAGEQVVERLAGAGSFRLVDIARRDSLLEALAGADLVINTAGPFQQGEPTVLDAAIHSGVAYLDIADDIEFARKARAMHERAVARGVSAVTNGGIFPGLSNVMAGAMIEEGGGAEQVDFYYHIAGTGGAGASVMSSTFFICAMPAIEYVDGRAVGRRAFTGRRKACFPAPLGTKPCYYFELPEVTSCFESYSVPNVSARFGTAPDFWNYATLATALLAPRSFLQDRERIAGYVEKTLPLIRKVDAIVGADVGMRIEVRGRDTTHRSMGYHHRDTLEATGHAVVAQALELLEGRVAAGVWWPEQAIEAKREHLRRATGGATLVDETG
jgi:saccharopine dehydrogenase-like NADP-dependent oxidoreductase